MVVKRARKMIIRASVVLALSFIMLVGVTFSWFVISSNTSVGTIEISVIDFKSVDFVYRKLELNEDELETGIPGESTMPPPYSRPEPFTRDEVFDEYWEFANYFTTKDGAFTPEVAHFYIIPGVKEYFVLDIWTKDSFALSSLSIEFINCQWYDEQLIRTVKDHVWIEGDVYPLAVNRQTDVRTQDSAPIAHIAKDDFVNKFYSNPNRSYELIWKLPFTDGVRIFYTVEFESHLDITPEESYAVIFTINKVRFTIT